MMTGELRHGNNRETGLTAGSGPRAGLARIRAVIVRDLHGKLLGLVPIRKVIAALGYPGGSVRMEDVAAGRGIADTDDATTDELLALMGRHRVRNLPVVAADQVVGLVSARDIDKARTGFAVTGRDDPGPFRRRHGIRPRSGHAVFA